MTSSQVSVGKYRLTSHSSRLSFLAPVGVNKWPPLPFLLVYGFWWPLIIHIIAPPSLSRGLISLRKWKHLGRCLIDFKSVWPIFKHISHQAGFSHQQAKAHHLWVISINTLSLFWHLRNTNYTRWLINGPHPITTLRFAVKSLKWACLHHMCFTFRWMT